MRNAERTASGRNAGGEPSRPAVARDRLIDARSLVAVCALSLSTFVQNGYVYPPFNAVVPWGFALCGLLYGAAFGLWAFAAHRSGSPLPVRAVTVGALAALAAGCGLWMLGVQNGYASALGVPGAALLSCGRSWAVIVAGLSLTRLRPRGVRVTMAGGVCLSYAVYLVLDPLLAACAPVVYALLPAVALAAVAGPVARLRAALPDGAPPSELALSNPGSFPGPFNRLFVCIFLFEVAFGLSITFGAGPTAWWQSATCGVALLALAAWCARTQRASREDALFHVSGLLVVFGFFVSAAQTAVLGSVALGALTVGAQMFSVLTWATLAIIAARNPSGGIAALGQGFCASNLGATTGVVLGHLPVAADAAGADVRLLLFALVAAAFVGYVWIGLKDFSFSAAIRGVKPVEEVEAPAAPEAAIDTRCAHLASVHGLTEREGEVFALLARGRNGAFIQEECRVTRNTAKTHIRHIYQKLGVHTQQELIDLVESGRDFIV